MYFGKGMESKKTYKAFISYSHESDSELAKSLQYKVERFSKKWFQIRSFKIFRDTSNLSASPGLWSDIVDALSHSEYLIYLASQEAAKSVWVAREISWWLENSNKEKLIIVLTNGQIAWDETKNDFDWDVCTSLPGELSGWFKEEPLYLKLNTAKSNESGEINSELLSTVCATLFNKKKDEIYGRHLKETKNRNRAALIIIGSLLSLLIAAIMFSVKFVKERDLAEKNKQLAEQRLSQAHLQAKETLGALWVYLLFLDYSDGAIDKSGQLNKILEVIDGDDPVRIQKAIGILTKYMSMKGVPDKEKKEGPTLSRFSTLYPTMFARKSKYPAMELFVDSYGVFWTWNTDELHSLEVLLKVLLNPKSPDTFQRYGKSLEGDVLKQYQYLYDLIKFASNPTIENIKELADNEYYYDTKELTKKFEFEVPSGMQVLTDYMPVYTYVVLNDKSPISIDEKKSIVIEMIERLSKTSRALYEHTKSTDIYTKSKSQEIQEMYENGVLGLLSTEGAHIEIERILPSVMLEKADILLGKSEFDESKKIYDKILGIDNDNFVISMRLVVLSILEGDYIDATDRIHKLQLSHQENNVKLDAYAKFIIKLKGAIGPINLTDYEKEIFSYLYSIIAHHEKNIGKHHEAIERQKLAIEFTSSQTKKARLYANLGWYLLINNQLTDSILASKQALAIEDNKPLVVANIASAFAMNGELLLAKYYLKKLKGVSYNGELMKKWLQDDLAIFEQYFDPQLTSGYRKLIDEET